MILRRTRIPQGSDGLVLNVEIVGGMVNDQRSVWETAVQADANHLPALPSLEDDGMEERCEIGRSVMGRWREDSWDAGMRRASPRPAAVTWMRICGTEERGEKMVVVLDVVVVEVLANVDLVSSDGTNSFCRSEVDEGFGVLFGVISSPVTRTPMSASSITVAALPELRASSVGFSGVVGGALMLIQYGGREHRCLIFHFLDHLTDNARFPSESSRGATVKHPSVLSGLKRMGVPVGIHLQNVSIVTID
jgi:hypothetical protein